jgi:hypothetical protein
MRQGIHKSMSWNKISFLKTFSVALILAIFIVPGFFESYTMQFYVQLGILLTGIPIQLLLYREIKETDEEVSFLRAKFGGLIVFVLLVIYTLTIG